MLEEQERLQHQERMRQAQAAEEEDDGNANHMDMEPSGFEGGPGGALVEEARKLMAQDEEDAPKEVENAGPKIKMNRICRKAKKGADASGPEKTGASNTKGDAPSYKPQGGEKQISGGFSEQDIEFMKKAIQVLC